MLKNKYGFTIDNMLNNIILLTDGYKFGHHRQRPDGVEIVSSYFESRGSILTKYGLPRYNGTVFFGLLYIIKKYLEGEVVTLDGIKQAKLFVDDTIGEGVFNEEGWLRILNKYNGRLPVIIRAVPEGTYVPTGNIMLDIENIGGKETEWLPNYLETILTHVWYTSIIATNSREIKKTLLSYHHMTSDSSTDIVDFLCHDFGFRGVTCNEQAGLGGMAHLTSFLGSDTTVGTIFGTTIYNASNIVSFTIPASEHSTATPYLRTGEVTYLENMLTKFPTGLVATVGDSFDIINFITNVAGGPLRDTILNRDGRWICRPDSGDPVATTAKVIEALWNTFGGTINSKGYKVLDTHVRMIQGDGVDLEAIDDILDNFKRLGYSSENIAFGSGGGLLQKFDRDTLKNAFKCSYVKFENGEERDVRKTPMEFTADGEYVQSFKLSKQGKMGLIQTALGLKTVSREEAGADDVLKVVFDCGNVTISGTPNWESIKERIAANLNKL